MDFEDSYYKRIVYKKNAYEDLKMYIKLNYLNKKICFVSSKSLRAEEVTNVLNALFFCSESVGHFVVRNNFDIDELNKLKNKLDDGYDIIVGLGGGRLCDVIKFFASSLKLPYIICPSQATSLSYFTNLCINPYDATKSFVANFPNKIFIQESIIRSSSCNTNINGLSFLHSLRAMYAEGILYNCENESYVYLGMEKLFAKLEQEQTNILLCNEDSNLVLMDLFIDFGFFVNILNKDFALLKSYIVYNKIKKMPNGNFVGNTLLLIAKAILCLVKEYLELNNFKIIEMPNFNKISKIIEKNKIFIKNNRNYDGFLSFMGDASKKKKVVCDKDAIYKMICIQLFKIKEFCKKVKTVYKHGIEISDSFENLMSSISVGLSLYNGAPLLDFVAGSGVLNAFIA